jgi:multiple sugar transport system ATP-binding protein
MAELSIKSLEKSFGVVKVIHNANLDVAHREFVVFVGPSGCGKSTLLRMIAGLESVTSGEIWIGGRKVNDLEPRRREISMVFQSYALYPHMTVYDNIAFGLKMRGVARPEIAKRVADAAAILKLEHLLKRFPKELSGGQRQRVAIGRSIVGEPQVFLFDEPLSNLDAALRVELRVELAKLHQRLNATMIYVTHDQTEAMTLADRIVVLKDGVIEQVGSPLELYQHPQNRFVAEFIGSPKMNFLAGRVDAAGDSYTVGVDRVGRTLNAPSGGGRTGVFEGSSIGVRPKDLHIVEASDPRALLPGRITVIENLGGSAYVYIETEAGQTLVAEVEGIVTLPEGAEVHVGADPRNLYLFDNAGVALPRPRS